MEGDLKKFVERFFKRHGALVESAGAEELEILAPPDLARQVGMHEWEQFYFTDRAGEPPATASAIARRRIGYDSDAWESMGKIVERHGLFTVAGLPAMPVKKLDSASDIEKALALQNAIFKLHSQEQTWGSYLIFSFKYTAFSDERREGLLSLAVNEATLNTSPGLVEAWSAFNPEAGRTESAPAGKSFAEVYTRGCRVARAQIRDTMAAFIKSMNRRMERDRQRLAEYYGAIQQEIAAKIKRKNLTGEDRARELSRIRATALEHERKMRDAQEKYNLDIKVDLIALLRLFVPVTIARLKILRRKRELDAALAWNPLTRDLEKLTCLSCYQSNKRIFICDDHRHGLRRLFSVMSRVRAPILLSVLCARVPALRERFVIAKILMQRRKEMPENRSLLP